MTKLYLEGTDKLTIEFSLIEFKYKPTTTSTPPTRKRIRGGHMLSGNISVINLGRLITRPKPPIKNITCSES